MVRVFKCHSFASQQVVPVEKEPLSICAVEDKIFVATADCEIVVYKVSQGTSSQIKKLPSISQVDKLLYNSFRSYIVTVELKKSWKRVTHSVRVYLNWENGNGGDSKSRTKVRVAGKSHVQHVSAQTDQNMVDIIEVPVDCHTTSIAVCRLTGNFAVACGHEVKLCNIVEKTVANTNRTYLDVEVFLELCWNFSVLSVSLCEEFVLCCSKTEVQGIKVKYVERQHGTNRVLKHSSHSPIPTQHGALLSKNSNDSLQSPSAGGSPQSVISDTFIYPESFTGSFKEKDIVGRMRSQSHGLHEMGGEWNQDLSNVGRRCSGATGAFSYGPKLSSPTPPINDEYFEEWNFSQTEGCNGSRTVCLPSLQSKITLAHCHHIARTVCSPVISDSSAGGNVKSNSGVEVETVIYLNDCQGNEEWLSVLLVPTHPAVPSQNLYHPPVGTDRMKSFYHSSRRNMCCYISSSRGGFLFQLSPTFTEISVYQYSNKASKVCCGKSHLHVAAESGIETYTSRWAAVALESMNAMEKDEQPCLVIHPPVKLDVCLCGHEPFMGVIDISAGNDFLALLSKVQYPPGSEESAWSLYVIHCFSVMEQFNEIMQFAEAIRLTGPASYIHLLQEAHFLISTNILFGLKLDEEIEGCLLKVCRLLGDYYAQPDQESWRLCSSYYKSLNICANTLVDHAKTSTKENKYGKGIIDYLERLLFSDADDSLLPSKDKATDVLHMFFHSAPEKLSRLILLSRLTGYKAEVACKYLDILQDDKAITGQIISTIDKLAMVQLQLDLCEVEMAHTQQESVGQSELIRICVQHPKLIYTKNNEFTPLAQLLRRRRSVALLDILVEMLDEGVMSLDSLLILLKNQDEIDMLHNAHITQVLELVLSNEKRTFLFESVASHLCEIYITQIKERKTSKVVTVPRSISQGTQYKFSLPQGNGHFAPRYRWLDELPPFLGSENMCKPCQFLEVKHTHGQSSQAAPKPIIHTADGACEKCQCCHCNENLLKLQSLLCSPCLSEDLAHHILKCISTKTNGAAEETTDDGTELEKVWDSIALLCEIKIDIKKAMHRIVDSYPKVVASFASTCLNGNISLYADLLKCLEIVMKNSATASLPHSEEVYVASYKDLLKKASGLFKPVQFLDLLPADGKVFFFLPYLVHNLELEHVNTLKCKITDMGSTLLTHAN